MPNNMLTILQGDAIEQLKTLPDGSVHCCVTSPPYWGLRNYKVDGQLGLERTPEEYVSKMVAVFREVKRVLRDDATCWLNLGDSYAQAEIRNRNGENAEFYRPCRDAVAQTGRRMNSGLKPKDLCGIPWRVAFALQADGWFLRQQMPWVKRNSMPESVTDRPATACEFVFLLSKSQKYFYDAEAVKLPASMSFINDPRHKTGSNGHNLKLGYEEHGAQNPKGPHRLFDKQRGHSRRHDGFNDRWDQMEKEEQCSGWRNTRNSDWFFEGLLTDQNGFPLAFAVNPTPYTESHFAVFPPNLVKPCILAGTSARGCCAKCGAPWERQLERKFYGSYHSHKGDGEEYGCRQSDGAPLDGDKFKREYVPPKTTGWLPTCQCNASIMPCTVLDPFFGSGTTGMVALELGRKAIGIELNPEYIPLIRQRCDITIGLPL